MRPLVYRVPMIIALAYGRAYPPSSFSHSKGGQALSMAVRIPPPPRCRVGRRGDGPPAPLAPAY